MAGGRARAMARTPFGGRQPGTPDSGWGPTGLCLEEGAPGAIARNRSETAGVCPPNRPPPTAGTRFLFGFPPSQGAPHLSHSRYAQPIPCTRKTRYGTPGAFAWGTVSLRGTPPCRVQRLSDGVREHVERGGRPHGARPIIKEHAFNIRIVRAALGGPGRQCHVVLWRLLRDASGWSSAGAPSPPGNCGTCSTTQRRRVGHPVVAAAALVPEALMPQCPSVSQGHADPNHSDVDFSCILLWVSRGTSI